MKEESKFRIGRIFYILLIFSFVVISAEGILFYGNKADTPFFFKLLLILQNIIKAFGFKTVISLNDAVGMMNSHPSVIHTIICYAYGLAVFTAPYCTLTFAYKILERLMSFVLNFGFVQKKDNIVIFGYNDDVKTILEDSDESDLLKKYCIYIVSEKEISSEEKYNISRAGRRFYNFDMSKADRKEDCRSLLNKVRAKYAKYIILFDESSMKNFALLQIFSLNNDDGGFISLLGLTLVMLSSLSYAIYLVYINRGPMKKINTSTITFYVILGGFLVMIPYCLLDGGLMLPKTTPAWINAIGLGFFPTVISLIFTSRAIALIGSTETAIFGALEPLTAVILGILILGETLTITPAIGMILIFVSVTVLMMKKK